MIKIKSSDAAFCAGIADHAIRNWRRHGHLPKYGGAHHLWTVDEVFRLWVLARFAEAGVSPRLVSAHVAQLQIDGSTGRVAVLWFGEDDPRFAVTDLAELTPTDGAAFVAVSLGDFPHCRLPADRPDHSIRAQGSRR